MSGRGSVLTTTFNPFPPEDNVAFNSTGNFYGATVSSEGSTSFINVASTTIRLPNNVTVVLLEAGLSANFRGENATTPDVAFQWLITDSGGSTFDNLSSTAVTISSPGTASSDDTRKAVVTGAISNYTGIGVFDVVLQAKSTVTTAGIFAKVKTSTYFTVSYFLNG